MKKKIKTFIVTIFGVVILFIILNITFIIYTQYKLINNIKNFSVQEYKGIIQKFPSNMNVGPVDNTSALIEKAKDIWNEEFDMNISSIYIYDITHWRLFGIFYDSEEECWCIITGKINELDGEIGALIRKDGKVLAIWK